MEHPSHVASHDEGKIAVGLVFAHGRFVNADLEKVGLGWNCLFGVDYIVRGTCNVAFFCGKTVLLAVVGTCLHAFTYCVL